MQKELLNMTLEELWELFPILLVAPKATWRQQYAQIKASLSSLLSNYGVYRISHIGSTAVDGIWAKDIVDVLVELSAPADLANAAKALENAGFIVMSNDGERISLNLGYTPDGFAEKVYHIHLRRAGDNDELYFRDYLNAHPQIAKEYEALKLRLWNEFPHNRDAYTAGKSAFVRDATAKAREEFAGRY